MRRALLAVALAVSWPIACGGDEGGGETASGGASTSGSATAAGGSGNTGASTSTAGTGGAPPCTASTLADSVRITSVTIDGAVDSRAVTAEAGATSVVAWAGTDGMVHVTPLDGVDERAGSDLIVDGTGVLGAAATPTDVALLVARAPDFMTFLRIEMSGTVLANIDLVGGGDHNTVGVEWFGEFARTGRLARQGDGTYAAYHALHRRWPDMIGHQGDTLRILDAQGTALGGGWGWGCSHSLDQRLAFGPTGLVPICASDCYPDKGIFFNHDDQQITTDPGANCAGGYNTLLGGLVAVASGFFFVYQDDQGGAHLGQFDGQGQAVGERTLSIAGSSRLARYDAGMLLGSDGGGATTIQALDAGGQDDGMPASVAAPLPDQDFESRSDGEVAWAVASGTALEVVRVRICTP